MNDIQDQKEYKIAEANKLIRATFDRDMTVMAHKLTRIAMSRINSMLDEDFAEIEIPVKELVDLLEIKAPTTAYRDVKRAARGALHTTIDLEGDGWDLRTLFSRFAYVPKTGVVIIKFNDDVREFLLQLRGQFTQIKLEEFLGMRHKYSFKLYEYLHMLIKGRTVAADNHVIVNMDIEGMRRATGTTDKFLKSSHFRIRVFQPFLEDVAASSPYHINVLEPIKDGRKLVGWRVDVWSDLGWDREQRRRNQLDGQMDISDYL